MNTQLARNECVAQEIHVAIGYPILIAEIEDSG